MKWTLASLTVAALTPLFAPPAHAQDATPAARAQAVELFDAAAKLQAQGRVAEACPKYAESYHLDPQLGAALHLADCLEQNGQLASAYATFREASELAGKKGDPRQTLADEHAKALEPKLTRLTVRIATNARAPGLVVERDGLPMPEATWDTAIAVDPGKHQFVAKAPGYKPWSVALVVGPNATAQTIDVPALEPLPPAPDPTPSPQGTDSGSGGTQRILGYVVGGAGIVGIGVGVGFALKKSSKVSDANAICAPTNQCPPGTYQEEQTKLNELNDEARTAGTISTVSYIVGGAALAGGIALVLTAPRAKGREQQTRVRLTPSFGPGGAGLFATSAF